MSAEVIKEFLVGVGIDVDKGSLSKFTKDMGQVATVAASVAVAIQAAAAGLFVFTQGQAEALDDLGDLAHRINSTAADVMEFGYVAQLTGSNLEAASSSLESLNKNIGDTALGIGKAKKIFEQLGISVKGQDGKLKNTTDLVWEIGDAIKGMESGKQSAILQRLGLDKTLLDAVTTDVTGLRDEFGKLYDRDEINNATADAGMFMDAYDRLKMSMASIMKKIAAKFFKPFTDNMNRLTSMVVEYAPKIVNAFAPFFQLILSLATFMLNLFSRVFSIVYSAISTLVGWVMRINDAFDGWLGKIALAIIAWKLFNAAILASPVGRLITLGVLILALVDDFLVWQEGGDSLFDWSAWMPWFDAFGSAINVLHEALRLFFDTLFETFGMLKELVSGNFSAALSHGSNIIDRFAQVGSDAGGALAEMNAPSPATQAAISANTSVNQKTEININGAGDPKAVANNVAGNQSRVNGDMVRNMKGATK